MNRRDAFKALVSLPAAAHVSMAAPGPSDIGKPLVVWVDDAGDFRVTLRLAGMSGPLHGRLEGWSKKDAGAQRDALLNLWCSLETVADGE